MLAETYYHRRYTMSAFNHDGLHEVLESIAMLNENHVMNKISFEDAVREINRNSCVMVCNNASVTGHLNGNSVTPAGLELVNHYRGGYHYFTMA